MKSNEIIQKQDSSYHELCPAHFPTTNAQCFFIHPSFGKHLFEFVFDTAIKDEEEDKSPAIKAEWEAEVDTDILKTIST